MNKQLFSNYIKKFQFAEIFNELGWDQNKEEFPITVKDEIFTLCGVADKRGFAVLLCTATASSIPDKNVRKKIEAEVTKLFFEHLIIFIDNDKTQQIWQVGVKQENKPKMVSEVKWHKAQDVEPIFQKLDGLFFSLDEEEVITIVEVKQRVAENFAQNTKDVTKNFYTDFKKQHTIFLDFIKGMDDHIAVKNNKSKQWYASLMLNRLMFCYFIQKKGFLNNDRNYLSNKLKECKKQKGNASFYSFYRSFLLHLFHDNLNKPERYRKKDSPIEIGKIPYLNGGLFDVHELEKQFDKVDISDDAFEKIFAFFDKWNWHLDNKVEATGKDINPDVIGYIFEKYINDRAAMGAYYTKEDITDYIGRNTIIPFLFDEVKRNYASAFKPNSNLWDFLKKSEDDYIYPAVKKGVPKENVLFDDLPAEVQKGIHHPLENKIVTDATKQHLWQLRQPWNQQVEDDEIALPTEIYRELIERRTRCNNLRNKIGKGDITEINDFITYNLDSKQFVQDYLEQTDDDNFIRHFYTAIRKITILDPTCGSGAFLFAALNILEPLYKVCIDRMKDFVETGNKHYKKFEEELAELEQHANEEYFIYKNIILNNLYGVDIMNEAVEIAKLRLFLKLVATVDVDMKAPNCGLEPLPDIDFNIRSGNTLVGFATEAELLDTIAKKEGMFAQDKLDYFKEECHLTSQAFSRFQDAQTVGNQGSEDFKEAKQQLQEQLKNLNAELNTYLATNYGIDATNPKQKDNYSNWLNTHQPFHWFAEYYGIVVERGGFEVIIGNPPYVLYSERSHDYKVFNFSTFECKNLYAYCSERAFILLKTQGGFGFIIPNSSISAQKMSSIQELFIKNKCSWISNYSWRPAKLFEGANMLLAIIISQNLKDEKLYSTPYYKWYAPFRDHLFENLNYNDVQSEVKIGTIPKLPHKSFKTILDKINANKKNINHYSSNNAKYPLYYFRAVLYWIKILIDIPVFREDNVDKVTGEMKKISFRNIEFRNIYASLLSSSLYFTYYINWASCQVINNRDLEFPLEIENIQDKIAKKLSKSNIELQNDYKLNSRIVNREYVARGRNFIMEKQYFYIKESKDIIDQIDTLLAQHYNFTEGELDFIINYDIKYRMGDALQED
jgi:hypothetical protein